MDRKDISTKTVVISVAVAALAAFLGVKFARSYVKDIKNQDPLLLKAREIKKKVFSGFNGNKNIIFFDTKEIIVQDKGIPFLVKILVSLAKKTKQDTVRSNPFLPPFEKGLFIGELGRSYNLLYNKFCVAKYHVLIVTKEFNEQNIPFSLEDFEASMLVMNAINGFLFFNSGPDAGASQKHRHLQAVPYESFPEKHLPIEETIKIYRKSNKDPYFKLPEYQFQHLFYFFEEDYIQKLNSKNQKEAARKLLEIYTNLLQKLGNENIQTPYNLMITDKWMLIVLRKQEFAFDTFSINALGFLGSFFLKKEEEFKTLNEVRPMNILNKVVITD